MTITCLSEIKLPNGCVVVFDLDDTLFPERDFVLSGFNEVARKLDKPVFERLSQLFDSGEKDVFGVILNETGSSISKESLIDVFRNHKPDLQLRSETRSLLLNLHNKGYKLGLITDGRSITQRNKIVALRLHELIDEIVISEEFGSCKPDERNYCHFEKKYPGRKYAYVGDNLSKDFFAPNNLGWLSICLLDGGGNIHPQNFDQVPEFYLPQFRIHSLA